MVPSHSQRAGGLLPAVETILARADTDLFEVDNLKVTIGFIGDLGMFGLANVDFGRGNRDYISGKLRANRS